jgi:hypothetical protein
MLAVVVIGIVWPILFLPGQNQQRVRIASCTPMAACAAKHAESNPTATPSTGTSSQPTSTSTSSSPNPSSTDQPAASQPSPMSAPQAPLAPASSGCAAPEAFPVGYFAPDLVGPATRVFQQQYITNFGTYVETCYPAGSTSPSSGVPGGAQASLPVAAGARDDATLTYSIRFPVGFTWVKGGKLPGLCGGQCWTDSNNGPGGFAMRLMWRAGGVGEVLLSDAVTTGYGTDLGRGTSFTFAADGRWHSIKEHVHLNTPGQPDGYIDLTYDGTLYHFGGLVIRTDSTHIDSLIFSTFFGGHDSTWAPTSAQRIDFSSFHVA